MSRIRIRSAWRKRGPRAADLLGVLLAASLLIPTLLLGVLGVLTYRAAFRDAEREIVQTSAIAREHASKVFDSFRLVADRVEDVLGDRDAASIRDAETSFHDRLRQVIAGLPQVQSLLVLDGNGHPLVATARDPVDREEGFADRDYFQALRGGQSSFISRVQRSRITGEAFFGWGRARHDGGGAFAGAIDIAVAPDFFMRFYDTLSREARRGIGGRVVTMIRDDGQMLVRYPGFDGDPGVVPPDSPFFAATRASPDAGVYVSRSVVDRDAPERLFAFNKVPGHAIYIVAGRSTSAIVAGWWRSMARYLAVGVPGAATLFLMTLATVRGTARERDALAQLRDETARRALIEDQLRQAQKMEAMGQLTGGIAHDFNNLLTVIRSSVDLLRRPDLPEERRRRYVDAIFDATTRAAKLTGQLLAFARRQTLNPETFDVAGNVRAVVDMVRAIVGSRIAIDVAFPSDACHVRADPSQFDTAIVNMAVNARDAMDGEGRLVIRVAAVDRIPGEGGRAASPGDYVVVAISDTGTGIAPDHLDRIFEPFFTTKSVGSGTGLGLSQVFGFAKQSGGDLRVDSELGRGTTFSLYLPRAPAIEPASKALVPSAPASVAGRGTRVLVVEDDPEVGEMTVLALAELGFVPVRAADASEALGQLARDGRGFDVVFSDVVMPGMTGIALGQEIRRCRPDLPVVLASGYSEVLAQGGTFGFDLIQKPYSVEQLARALLGATRERRTADQVPTPMPPGWRPAPASG